MMWVRWADLRVVWDRKIGASREQARRERDAEERENGYGGTADEDEDEMDL